MFFKKKRVLDQKGQALLIVVLVVVIGLTIGLSIATRTIVNLRNTSDQAASQKALSAAEAGIEQAIKNDVIPVNHIGPSGSFYGTETGTANTTYATKIDPAGGGTEAFLLNGLNGAEVAKNDAIYVWVKPYTDNFTTSWSGDLTIYWGSEKGNCADKYSVAALEVSIIRGTKQAPNLERYAIDPCNARANTNHFLTIGSSPPVTIGQSTNAVSGKNLYYNAVISGLTNVLLVRINPIYTDALIGVKGTTALAAQGKIITSTGTSNQGTVRKITVFEGYPEIPAEFFPFSLFSH